VLKLITTVPEPAASDSDLPQRDMSLPVNVC
jgi:hypothetical protein